MRHAPLLVLGLILACSDETQPIDATPAHAPSVPPVATPATPESAVERRCGEAGPTPTVLPPLLASPLPSLGWLVEVVDVQATGDARREGNDWLTSAPVPPLHVQLRVSQL